MKIELIQQCLEALLYKLISVILYCRIQDITQAKVSDMMNHAVFKKSYSDSSDSKNSHKTGAMGT